MKKIHSICLFVLMLCLLVPHAICDSYVSGEDHVIDAPLVYEVKKTGKKINTTDLINIMLGDVASKTEEDSYASMLWDWILNTSDGTVYLNDKMDALVINAKNQKSYIMISYSE